MSGTRAISTTSRRELSSSFFFYLQSKGPKEIQAIVTETLACFLPGQAKDLSAHLRFPLESIRDNGECSNQITCIPTKENGHVFRKKKCLIIIIILIFIYCNWVVNRWQWLFYIYTKYEIVY